jgi:hypothetical protein
MMHTGTVLDYPDYRQRRRRARANVDNVPHSPPHGERMLRLCAASAVFVTGLGLVVWDYALRLPHPANYTWFWVGIGLCLLGVLAVGLWSRARSWEHTLALAACGAALYLPYVLRSPTRLIFNDALYHDQIAQLIAERGHTDVPVTLYPIPGDFPGLELATLGLTAVSGLPIDAAERLLTLLTHVTVPLLAYLIARGLGLGARVSFIAAMVYIANTGYYFFHSVFSYESLGIVFVLALWALVVRRARRVASRDLALVVPVLGAATVTHHISSYMLACGLVIAWLVQRLLPRDPRDTIDVVALCSVLCPLAWLVLQGERTATYLHTSIASRLGGVLRTVRGEHAPRQLFYPQSPLPVVERIVDFLYAPLLLALALGGLYLIVHHGGWRRVPPAHLSLAVFGPLAWLATTPIVLTPSAEAAYRSWPFLFVGMAVYGAVALSSVAARLGARMRPMGPVVVAAVLGVLLAGGISLGDNQAGRFPMAYPLKAAGPEAITADLVSAARWLERTAGRYHMIVGDSSSQVTFATYGYQRARSWGSWTPFVERQPDAVTRYLRETNTEYVVIDRRISRLLSRYRTYFGQAEIYGARRQHYRYDRPFPAVLLAKFERVDALSRIYDNGDIQIFKALDLSGRSSASQRRVQ